MNKILLKETKAQKKLPLQSSKFFGVPDVWDGFKWPTATDEDGNEYPIYFMCQINCAEASKHDKDGIMPKTGMLYFFYDIEERPWEGKAPLFYYDGDPGKLSPYAGKLPECVGKDHSIAFEPQDSEDIPSNEQDDDSEDYLSGSFLLGVPTDPEQMGLGDTIDDEWQLVLELDSYIGDGDFNFGGDCGRLCYFVNKSDFAKKDFSKAWFMLAVY
jgi:uncharacterized protein YwqG